ncbi:unnamed protein product [Acanthoscelides obtectus]|uniref:Uncharacterized protein n=1 Tax=Acanthoscelides obtectus TaxID=200917 RepID=A0A9P0LKX4_ACAOB|nr:unnamed protein product [Acanthoscelides obtectus]CAK1635810.1 hypothetical protein AOBTE_LOCUS9526 [Acanthoscelides obtectus]
MQQYEMLRIVIHKSRCYRISVGDRYILFLDSIQGSQNT